MRISHDAIIMGLVLVLVLLLGTIVAMQIRIDVKQQVCAALSNERKPE